MSEMKKQSLWVDTPSRLVGEAGAWPNLDHMPTSLRDMLLKNGIDNDDIAKYFDWISEVAGAPRTKHVPLQPCISRESRDKIENLLWRRHLASVS